ncbi:hypothetical protein GCM10022252_15880 [Streptosporangium oxazolinicum]|uniref:Uncharacterized protein n=1 Tax=Streptosporangium oxazolinicum TaxID=909287 RepID=A0ABP8AKI7_9ACTN
MNTALYDNAMQVVPVLLIALFLDSRGTDRQTGHRPRRWENAQDRLFALLGVVAFVVSMLVVAGVVDDSRVTAATVIAALSGCIGLLFARIWFRLIRDSGQVRE